MPAYQDDGFDPPAPVAQVTLLSTDNAGRSVDVPMLMDTGADVSLIPHDVVESLGLSVSGERFEWNQ
jgi:hypothetical protein